MAKDKKYDLVLLLRIADLEKRFQFRQQPQVFRATDCPLARDQPLQSQTVQRMPKISSSSENVNTLAKPPNPVTSPKMSKSPKSVVSEIHAKVETLGIKPKWKIDWRTPERWVEGSLKPSLAFNIFLFSGITNIQVAGYVGGTVKNRGSAANDDKFDFLIVKRSKKLLNVSCQHDAFAPLFSTPQRPLPFHSFA